MEMTIFYVLYAIEIGLNGTVMMTEDRNNGKSYPERPYSLR